MKGRKRVMIVDVEGNLLACAIVPADVPEREALRMVLDGSFKEKYPELSYLLVDQGFSGSDFKNEIYHDHQLALVVVEKGAGWEAENAADEMLVGFVPLKWRWIVERTFAWLSRCRRLAKDYEHLVQSVKSWINLAMLKILLDRHFR